MADVAKEMQEKKVSSDSDGAVIVDFTELVPGKEGKRLGKAVVRFVHTSLSLCVANSPSNVESMLTFILQEEGWHRLVPHP
jgi:hypothetical protein